jgi:hypothetical protein
LRAIWRFALLAMFLSAASFAVIIHSKSDWGMEWTPVRLPFPGKGIEVSSFFHISSRGEFELQVSVPSSDSHPQIPWIEPPALPCNLQIEINSPDGSMIRESVGHLWPCGMSPGILINYRAEPLSLPHSGDYMFHLRNLGESPFLCSQGAGIEFTRFQHPTGWTLRYVLLQTAGWVFLVLGFSAVLVAAAQDYLSRRSIDKEA